MVCVCVGGGGSEGSGWGSGWLLTKIYSYFENAKKRSEVGSGPVGDGGSRGGAWLTERALVGSNVGGRGLCGVCEM